MKMPFRSRGLLDKDGLVSLAHSTRQFLLPLSLLLLATVPHWTGTSHMHQLIPRVIWKLEEGREQPLAGPVSNAALTASWAQRLPAAGRTEEV